MVEQAARILIIDDSRSDREILSVFLQNQGYEVVGAENGEQGLRALQEGPVDVVLLDLMLPDVDGHQILAQIKEDRKLQHIPIIVISGLEDVASITNSIKLGAMDYLSKPFDAAQLGTRLEAALASKRFYDADQASRLAEETQWVGRTVGNYIIEKEIGQGATAVVYRAFQPQLERWVAIKFLKSKLGLDEEFLARFHQEAKAVAQLRHPNILTVYDYGEEAGHPYIVMEYVSVGTLEEHLSPTPMPWEEVAGYVLPVARALAYAHKQGLVHCDVKPANILLARTDWVLLADFGLASLLSESQAQPEEYTISGTPAYASPEQLFGQDLDQRVDIYALAIVIYQMLTARFPFAGDTITELMLSRLHHLPMMPSGFNPDIPPKLEMALLRALSRSPENRQATMEQFIAELEAVPLNKSVSGQPINETAILGTAFLSEDIAPAESSGPHFLDTTLGTSIPLPRKEEILIGRADSRSEQNPDIDLEPHRGSVAGVSRHHARLHYSAGGWFLQDLNSTNGSFVNNERVSPHVPVRIRHGDAIRFGRLHLAFFDKQQ